MAERETTGPEDVPVAVMNYRTRDGWRQVRLAGEAWNRLQQDVRYDNVQAVAESICDAKDLLAAMAIDNARTPQNVLALAVFLAERRIPPVSRAIDTWLRLRVAQKRYGSR